ncbi:MAG: hypothetical protein GY856_10885 [bacterium]|nr:hypothetical protein [bacterium]
MELIFFPTGGGKTEAYLGVIAFCLVLRRLRGRDRPDGGYGVAVILRYTLRLLTLDQLRRAATLICALELLRRRPRLLGEVRFTVGLWVGKSATANTMKEIAEQIGEYKSSTSATAVSPFPLTHCPWCRERLSKSSLDLKPTSTDPSEIIVGCDNFECDFAPAVQPDGLPVLFVDEQVYRELPSFLVATVDKFAMLPWRGETGMLFGRVHSRDRRSFYVPLDNKHPGEALPEGLPPPELIVQDELHLISGPLGTMVGLHETAVDALCRGGWADLPGPKVLASTATVRRARQQVQALFGRRQTAIFPPPAVDASETFFARIDQESPGRLYIGLAAPGRAMKAVLLRTYVALLSAAQRAVAERGGDDPTADAYMTLAGYFNSLRELGGMRRLVEDEASQRCREIEKRRPLGLFRFDHGEEIFRPLHGVMKEHGVETAVFLDVEGSWKPGQEGTTAELGDRVGKVVDRFFAENWTFGEPKPEIYYDPRTVQPFSKVSLHAKCIVVDRRKTLVTSANFTDRGQTRNIEVGVLIEDGAFATRLHEQWWGLVSAELVHRSPV